MALLNAFQQAAYQQMNTDNALLLLVNGVYDRTVQNTAFPYVSIGEMTASDWSSKTSFGAEIHMMIDIWSREGGRKETISIIERINTLLHDASFAVSGYTLVLLRLVNSQVKLEKDGWTYHGIMKFRALLEAN